MFAFIVFDASAKFIPTGWLDGSTYNLGNFDECVDVEVSVDNNDYIQGQYCLVEIEINPTARFEFRSREHAFNESSWDTVQASQTYFFFFRYTERSDNREVCIDFTVMFFFFPKTLISVVETLRIFLLPRPTGTAKDR